MSSIDIDKVQLLRSTKLNTVDGVSSPLPPPAADLDYGEIAINYAKGYETLFIKNNQDEVVSFGQHQQYTTSPTESSVTLNDGDSFVAIKSLTVENGHITGYETDTYTLPHTITALTTDDGERLLITNDADEEVEFVPKAYIDNIYKELMLKLMEFANKTSYKVTYQIDGVILNETPSVIEENNPLSITFNVRDGRTLDNVIVTMGDVDITESAYNESVSAITITEVTGNVTIQISALTDAYTITYNLSNMSSTNKTTRIDHGSVFNTILNVDEYYELDSVTIFMDGVNITDEVYTEGMIVIPSVTGSIIINGVASRPSYTVTSNLTEVSMTPSNTVVERGESFSATLTPTSNYVFDSVVVIMGGMNITSNVYADGVINIEHVTDNVEITASAVLPQYSIVNNLTNIETDNTTITIINGDSYNATLTPSIGYDINSVTVLMGGQNVTALYYNDGVINIPQVNGDIIITANAVLKVFNITYNIDPELRPNNDAATAEYGSMYSLVLNPTTGMEVGTVQVLMGGVDITDQVRVDNLITIPSVTGDITIIASTSAQLMTITHFEDSHTTISNTATTIPFGSQYTTTITVERGYDVNVMVTMGGVNITDTAYDADNKTVTIDNVTGAITVTTSSSLANMTVSYSNADGFVQLDNVETTVPYNTMYTSALIVTTGYKIDSVIVMMGTEDISDSVYSASDKRITIPNVQDDVTITVSASIIVYNIAYNVDSHASLDNDASTINYGLPYQANVTIADYYELETISVTMGGVALPDAFDGTTISIPSVTGDINITIVTRQEDIGTIGYVDADAQNAIVINDNALKSGTYTLKYETEDGNEIDNINNIITFTI